MAEGIIVVVVWPVLAASTPVARACRWHLDSSAVKLKNARRCACGREGLSYVGCVRACVHGMGWEVYHFLFDPEKVASGVHGGHDA